MTTTVDIPDDVSQPVMAVTGARSAQEAVLRALEQLVKRRDQRSLIPLLGTLDGFMTPEELDEMRSAE